jgi:hypothetical protein
MKPTRLLVGALILGVTGCAGSAPALTTQPSSTTATTLDHLLVSDVAPDELIVDATPHVVEFPSAPMPGLVPVEVDGGALPDVITSTYLGAGGQLLDPESFATEFGVGGLPFPVGLQVYLTDASISVSSDGGGKSVRSDALGYLFTDARPLADVLDAFAVAARIGRDFERVETVVDGGSGTSCQQLTYLSKLNDGAAVWTFSGCAYLGEGFNEVRAVQVTRTGTFIEAALVSPPALSVLQAQLDPLTTATGGRVSEWSYDFSKPHEAGSATLRTEVTVTYPAVADFAALQAALTNALPGFTSNVVGAKVMLTNGPLSWTIEKSSATLRVASRVAL